MSASCNLARPRQKKKKKDGRRMKEKGNKRNERKVACLANYRVHGVIGPGCFSARRKPAENDISSPAHYFYRHGLGNMSLRM